MDPEKKKIQKKMPKKPLQLEKKVITASISDEKKVSTSEEENGKELDWDKPVSLKKESSIKVDTSHDSSIAIDEQLKEANNLEAVIELNTSSSSIQKSSDTTVSETISSTIVKKPTDTVVSDTTSSKIEKKKPILLKSTVKAF